MERRVNLATGGVASLIGVVALVKALSELDFLGSNKEPGPGLFPELMAGALLVLGALLIVLQFRGGVEESDQHASPDARERLTRAAKVWVSLVLSIPVMGLVGFVVAMLLLAAFLILILERQRTWGSVATVVLLPVMAYVLFAVLLEVRLPMGVFAS